MARPTEQLTPERLCDAAEAVLKAAAEVGQERGGEWPYPVSLVGGPHEPDCLGSFERWEIQQASEFLVRLGIISPPRQKKRFW